MLVAGLIEFVYGGRFYGGFTRDFSAVFLWLCFLAGLAAGLMCSFCQGFSEGCLSTLTSQGCLLMFISQGCLSMLTSQGYLSTRTRFGWLLIIFIHPGGTFTMFFCSYSNREINKFVSVACINFPSPVTT